MEFNDPPTTTAEAGPDASQNIVPCLIDDDLYCFDRQSIQSIIQASRCKLNEAPVDGVVGEAVFAKREIPVLGLRHLLGYPTDDRPQQECVVIASTSRGDFGFLVDMVLHARSTVLARPIPAVTQQHDKHYFSGVLRLEHNANDVSRGPTNSTAALLLACDGLAGDLPHTPSFILHSSLDLSGWSKDLVHTKGQLMLFDLPHQDWHEQAISIATSVTQVLEVTGLQPLLPVPCAPEQVLGLVAWRDQFVPVIDVAKQLGLDTMPEQMRRRIVIARSSDGELIGFYASSNIRTIRMPEAQPITMDEVAMTCCVRGCFATQEGAIIVPSIKRLAQPRLGHQTGAPAA